MQGWGRGRGVSGVVLGFWGYFSLLFTHPIGGISHSCLLTLLECEDGLSLCSVIQVDDDAKSDIPTSHCLQGAAPPPPARRVDVFKLCRVGALMRVEAHSF